MLFRETWTVCVLGVLGVSVIHDLDVMLMDSELTFSEHVDVDCFQG
jgi:hypothetical protein